MVLVKHSTPEANTLPLCGHIHPFMLQVWVYYTTGELKQN